MQKEKWIKFTKKQQLGAIAAEIMRAKVWQDKDKDHFLSAIERAINLIDASLEDRRWKDYLPAFFGLRNKIAEFYLGVSKDDLGVIFSAL